MEAARAAITCRQNMFPTCYGTELTSNAILKWQEDSKLEWHYIAQESPWNMLIGQTKTKT